MQQPMGPPGPPDPMGQHQVMLCPVRLVYETQILLQPGEPMNTNQGMFMNAQNPPPWIQNRPQNPVIYMQQIPNSMMTMPQQMLTDQGQLYIPNYPYQPQMMQIDQMRQMPNVMTQNMMGLGANVGQTMHNVGPGLQNVGQGMQNAGQGLQNVGSGLQNVGPGSQNIGLQNVGPGLQNVGHGLQNVGPGLQIIAPGLQNVGQGSQNVGPGSQNVGQGLQNVGPGLQNIGQSIQNLALNIGQNMPMGNVVQNVQKSVSNFTQNIGNDRIVYTAVPNATNNAMGMVNNQATFHLNVTMPERPQMNQNLVNMQKVSELQGLKQQSGKPPRVSVSPMPNAKFGPNIGDRSMTLTSRPQTSVSNVNLGLINVQANAMANNKVPLPNKASPSVLVSQLRNHNQTYYRPIQPRPMSVIALAQNQYQPMQCSTPALRPYTQVNNELNRKRKSESPDDTRKKFNITNNNFSSIHNQLIALHGSPNVQTFNITNTMNKVVQNETGMNMPLQREMRPVKNVATASTGTQANIGKPGMETLKKALEMKALPAIINDDLLITLQADNDKLLRNTVFTQARGLLRTEPMLQPDIISIKKLPIVTPKSINDFENVQNTVSNPSNFDDFSIEIIENVVEPVEYEDGAREPNYGSKKDVQVEIVIKRMNDLDDEPATRSLPNRDPERSTLIIEEVKTGLKKATETSNTATKTRELPNLYPIRTEEGKTGNKMATETLKTSYLANFEPEEPIIEMEEEKARNKMAKETLKTRIKTRYLANLHPEEHTIGIQGLSSGDKTAPATLKSRIKTRYLANLEQEEPKIRVDERRAENKRATERLKTKNKSKNLPNLEESTMGVEEENAEIEMAAITQRTRSKEKKRLKKETKEPKEERKVKVTSISDFKGSEMQIAEGNMQNINTESYILTHVLDGYVIQESNMAFPIRKPLKEKIIYQNSDKTSDQKKEESFKHRTEDGKVIQDNSRILAISDLNLSEDDDITENEISKETSEVKSKETSEEKSIEQNEEKSKETSIEQSEEKSKETSIEQSEEKSKETSEEKSKETSGEKSIEQSEEKSKETSEERSKEGSEEISIEKNEEKSKETSEKSEEISEEKTEEICDDNPFTNLTPDTIKSWSAMELTAHLSKYNWTETITALTEHEIDGESLFLVSHPQLVHIGVSEAHADIICEFIK